MGMVYYRCPTSGEEVTTAIETGPDTLVKMRALDLTIWAWCPHCMAGHQIKPADASVDDRQRPAVGIATTITPSFAAS
jgi:hypothetical protein